MKRLALLGAVGLVACAPPGPALREPGVRAPLSAACDALDETRCLLPWPSSTFTVADPSTATGVRVSISPHSMPVLDNPAPLNRLDGFSVATTLAVGFSQPIAAGLSGQKQTTAARLFHAQPGREGFGAEVPLRLHVVNDPRGESLLLAYPQHPLEYDTDYVAAVLDEVRPEGGGSFTAPHATQVALGLVPAQGDDEQKAFAYHAPTRAALRRGGVEFSRVLRVWDFTTRSAASVARPMEAMRAAALQAPLEVTVDTATPRDGGGLEVRGHVSGLPLFVSDAGVLSLDADGLPRATGTHQAPFRVVLPVGAGALPVAMFGHGTGGDVTDDGLDDTLLATGAAKVNLEFAGWTGASVPTTFLGFEHVLSGSERSTAGLAQSLIDASALEASLSGALGATITGPSLGGVPNPAAGRILAVETLGYFGSSLGGTLGFAHAQFEPRVRAAVLNVPGAGCAQFLLHSELWTPLDAIFAASGAPLIDRTASLVMSQSSWDLIDGAAWATQPGLEKKALLIQESIGDAVLPNLGSELVASASKAVQLSRVIEPVAGVEAGAEVRGGAALTQYRLPAAVMDSGAIHAFVTKGTEAGAAAREQLSAFFVSVWTGAPRAVAPPTCAARALGCDFQ